MGIIEVNVYFLDSCLPISLDVFQCRLFPSVLHLGCVVDVDIDERWETGKRLGIFFLTGECVLFGRSTRPPPSPPGLHKYVMGVG